MCNYQFIKELFPAEWFPIIITIIFLRGGNSLTPKLSAIFTSPVKQIQTNMPFLIIHDDALLHLNNNSRLKEYNTLLLRFISHQHFSKYHGTNMTCYI